MCGEKAAYLRAVWVPKGSPPHVRGKEELARTVKRVTGITPACAGKRSKSMTLRSLRGDHPRVCGEKTLCPSTVSPT